MEENTLYSFYFVYTWFVGIAPTTFLMQYKFFVPINKDHYCLFILLKVAEQTLLINKFQQNKNFGLFCWYNKIQSNRYLFDRDQIAR